MTDTYSFSQLTEHLIGRGNVKAGKLFGRDCLNVNGKAFCALIEQDVIFKLDGEAHHMALGVEGAHLFDPSGKGRPMKHWVQVPGDASDTWQNFGDAALAYVEALTRA